MWKKPKKKPQNIIIWITWEQIQWKEPDPKKIGPARKACIMNGYLKKDMALLASSNVISFSDIHSYHDKKIGWNDNYRIHNDTIKKAMLLEITHRTFLSLTAKYL